MSSCHLADKRPFFLRRIDIKPAAGEREVRLPATPIVVITNIFSMSREKHPLTAFLPAFF